MTRKRKTRSAGTIPGLWAVAVVLMIGCLLGASVPPAGAMDVLLGTRAAGSFSHFAGRTVCRLVENSTDDISCRAVPGAGDVHNLTNLRVGSLDMALIDSRMLHDAARRTGYFRFLDIRYDSLKTISAFYDLPVALVVRTDARIDSLSEVKGKRINAGAPRSAEHLAFDTILEAKGWTPGDFSLVEELSSSQSLDTMAFCHGSIQAMFHIGVHPNDSLRQLLRLCEARLAPMYDSDIEKLLEQNPALFPVVIAAGAYPSQREPIPTFGSRAVLVVSGDLDAGTVARITQVVHQNREQLALAHPALSPFPEDMPPGATFGIDPHPGVLRFFSERSP